MESTVFALDVDLDRCIASEAAGEGVSLPLRRFQQRWDCASSAEAMTRAVFNLLGSYRRVYPGASPVVRISKLCELLGVQLTGIPNKSKASLNRVVTAPPAEKYSGMVQFSSDGRASIQVPDHMEWQRARISVAHELGHLLIRRSSSGYDLTPTRTDTSDSEEAIAEYAARLILLPEPRLFSKNLAESSVRWASDAEVTVHAAVGRLGDPDLKGRVRGAILWKLTSGYSDDATSSFRFTPTWHLCPRSFIPIGKCRARTGSLIADLGEKTGAAVGLRTEEVSIGTFHGTFNVHAFAWGSISGGKRLVLSIFEERTAADDFYAPSRDSADPILDFRW